MQQLSLTTGYNHDLGFFTVFWNMASIITYPVVLWAGLTIGAFVGWYVHLSPCFYQGISVDCCFRNIVVQVTAARVLVHKPYHLSLFYGGRIRVCTDNVCSGRSVLAY